MRGEVNVTSRINLISGVIFEKFGPDQSGSCPLPVFCRKVQNPGDSAFFSDEHLCSELGPELPFLLAININSSIFLPFLRVNVSLFNLLGSAMIFVLFLA